MDIFHIIKTASAQIHVTEQALQVPPVHHLIQTIALRTSQHFVQGL